MKQYGFEKHSKIPSENFLIRAFALARFWCGASRHYTKNIMPARASERFQTRTASFKMRGYKEGFGLIEVVVVTALAVTALFGFAQAGSVAVRLLRAEQENLEATLLAQEALEAVRSVRDESWKANIAWRTQSPLASPSLRYYPTIVASKWSLATTSPGLVDGTYDRYVIFEQVRRDESDDIALSGGTDDPGTRKVTAVASSTAGRSVSLTGYITDFQSYLGIPTESKVISFENAITDADLISFPSNDAGTGDPAQGFTIGSGAISASKVELLLRRTVPAPSDIYAELRTSPTGAVLGTSHTISAGTMIGASPAWVEFRFPDPVALSAGTKYYIRLRSTPPSTDSGSGSMGAVQWAYQQTASSPYAGGEARRFVGRLSNSADAGQQLDQYDFGFRVYAIQ